MTSEEEILFDRLFREALVGNEFVYPLADKFSPTNYVRHYADWPYTEVEISIADYHLMMCAKSDDRIWYIWQVLLDLERK